MLQKIWKIVIFHLSLYNKTWDSPTLINLTNLTREVRYRQVSDLFSIWWKGISTKNGGRRSGRAATKHYFRGLKPGF